MESKTEIISSKLCPLCNEVNKFKMVNGRMSGRRCIKCTSKANNQKLKEKDYYWFPFFNSDVFYGRRLQFIFKLKQQEQNNLIVNANEVFRVGNNG